MYASKHLSHLWRMILPVSVVREAGNSCDEALQVELHSKRIPADTGQQGELSLGFVFSFSNSAGWHKRRKTTP